MTRVLVCCFLVAAFAGPGVAACSSGSSGDAGGAGAQVGSGGATGGTGGGIGASGGAGNASGSLPAGASCQTDADCTAGARCLDSLVPGPTGYCAPTCTTHDDCFAEISPEIAQLFHVPSPEKFGKSHNQWNSDDLWRGLACATSEYSDQLAPGESRCLMLCPTNSAVTYDDAGGALSCACMPHHHDVDGVDGSQDCVWDADEECSIFFPTCTTGTSLGECSSGQFTCLVGEDLDGQCVDDFTQVDVEQCVYEKCGAGGCDVGCLAGCGASELCVEACCSCK